MKPLVIFADGCFKDAAGRNAYRDPTCRPQTSPGPAPIPRLVAISRSQPRGWTGRVFEPLAPSWRLVQEAKSGAIDEEEYIRRYHAEVLSKLDPVTVHADLGEDAVLLCWERPGAFCHRRLVAEWLEEKLRISVPEVGEVGGERQARLGEW